MGVDTLVFFDLGLGGNFFCGLLNKVFYGGEDAWVDDRYEYHHHDKQHVMPYHYYNIFETEDDSGVNIMFKVDAVTKEKAEQVILNKYKNTKVIIITNTIDTGFTYMLALYKHNRQVVNLEKYKFQRFKSEYRKAVAQTYLTIYRKFEQQGSNVIQCRYQDLFIDVLDSEIDKIFNMYNNKDQDLKKLFKSRLLDYKQQQEELMKRFNIKWRM